MKCTSYLPYFELLICVLACHHKNYLCYHLPTRGRAGIKLGDVDTSQTYLYFCLFHAYVGDIAMCFATLSYLFTHIWTNLLTQCTQCQFLSADVCELQGFTHIYRAQKIPKYIYKKSARQKIPEDRRRTGAGPPPPRRPGRMVPLLAAPRGRLGGGATPWCPLRPIFI